MKIILFFVLLIANQVGVCQITKGYYNLSGALRKGFVQHHFYFENQSFRLIYSSCTNTAYGLGDYQIKNDTLHLNFKNVGFTENYSTTVSKSNIADSCRLIVNVFDKNIDKHLPGATCLISKARKGNLADASGQMEMMIPKKICDSIIVEYIGFNQTKIPICNLQTDTLMIHVYMQAGYSFYKPSDSFLLKINVNRKGFVLWFFKNAVQFRRGSKKRFRTSLQYFNQLSGSKLI